VAMTRAKDELDLIVPQRFFTHQQAKLGDRHVYAPRSRFIPDSILCSFATRSWRDQAEGPDRGSEEGGLSRRCCEFDADVAISGAAPSRRPTMEQASLVTPKSQGAPRWLKNA
jgi:hypothetical protein